MVMRRLKLTREQLAAFLTDPEQIRQFELLFSMVDEMGSSGADAINITIGNVGAQVQDAIAAVNSIRDALDRLPPPGDDEALSGRVQALEAMPLPAYLTRAEGNAFYAINGTYTPGLFNVANLTGSTAYSCQYLRVGNTVTVSGRVDVQPTAPAAATQLGIGLPVASNFGATEDCGGVAFASAVAGQGAGIRGDAANNRAEMVWTSGDITNQPMYFTFTYEVI